jgi:DNA repair exonuclease SbcCD ATPase subunit
MTDSQLEDLVEDIKQNGLLEPIVVYQNQILDGWHRWSACQRANITPEFVTYGGENPIDYVKSKNLNRRHLSEAQRAMAVVACYECQKNNKFAVVSSNELQNVNAPIGVRELAEDAQVGMRSISRAKLAYDAGMTEEVMAGDISLYAAEQQILNKPKKTNPKNFDDALSIHLQELNEKVKNLENEITALRDRNEELQTLSEDLLAENEMMQKILEEDERFPAALKEIKNLQDRIRIYKEQMTGLQNQANEAIRLAKKATKQNARPSE